jgi:predicted acetyltransferase
MELKDARESGRTRALLRRLFPLYIHDLSPYTTFYTMDARGRWRPELWKEWLSNPYLEAWLIEDRGELVGFAIVGHRPFPYMSPDRQHKLCEFFVLSAHRRRGVGRDAAARVFDLHQGLWELTVLPRNEGAHGFWKSVVDGYTGRRFEEVQLPGEVFFRFAARV